MLVHPDHLNLKPEIALPPEPPENGGDGTDEPETPPEPPKKLVKRFYGKVHLDPQRVNRDVTVIVEEVIQRLTSQLGTDVEIVLEVRANKEDGFDESTIRTITENSRTLNFDNYGFEK